MSIIQKICNRVAVMETGEIIEAGNVIDVFGDPQHATTRNFVQTVIAHDLPPTIRKKIKPIPGSRLVKVKFIQEANVVINELIKKHDLNVHMIYASINEIKSDTIGYFIIQLVGRDTVIQEAISILQDKNVLIKELT